MEVVENLHHTYDTALSIGDLYLDGNDIYCFFFSCSMCFQQFIKRNSLESSTVHFMDSNAVSPRLGDNLLTRLGLTFMTKIIVDKFVSIHHDRQSILERIEIFLNDFYRREFMLESHFFWIDTLDKLRICSFFINNSEQFFFYIILGIFFADLISRRKNSRQIKSGKLFIELIDCLFQDLIFLLRFEEFGQVVFGTRRRKKFQSMFVGRKFIFESIDFDDISCLWSITYGLDFSVDNCVLER